MLFNSPLFLFVFLPILVVVYLLMPQKGRNMALLVGSACFYAWGEPRFVVVVILSALLDWLLGFPLAKRAGTFAGKVLLAVGVASNTGILIYYKYANFFVENLNVLLHGLGVAPLVFAQVLLPIGVSFIVFEKITYLVDIYRRTGHPSRFLVNYLTYVFLFPKLLAGPIVKYHDIEQQLERRSASWDDVFAGTSRFIMGLAKKVFVADTVSEVADMAFHIPPQDLGASMAWLGLVCFTLQIYFDFSAYSDMAIGLARLFGFRLKENFNMPYLSQSFTEFWQRWHISLSSWIREYVYLPLGGNRCSNRRRYFNLWMSFLLSGIWHGANWTFVLWGVYHGFFIVLDKILWAKLRQKLPRLVNVAVTFFFVMLGWAIFRAANIGQAAAFVRTLFDPTGPSWGWPYLTENQVFFLVLGLALVFLPLFPVFERLRLTYAVWRWRLPVNMTLAFAALLLSVAKLSATTFQPFLYFRF